MIFAFTCTDRGRSADGGAGEGGDPRNAEEGGGPRSEEEEGGGPQSAGEGAGLRSGAEGDDGGSHPGEEIELDLEYAIFYSTKFDHVTNV